MTSDDYYIENEMVLSIFLWLLGNCIEDARASYAELKSINRTCLEIDQIRQKVWNAVDDFLKDTSSASKFLFPSSKAQLSKKRGLALCDLLEIGDNDFQGLRSRKLRNRVEHFDETLDKWWSGKQKNQSTQLAYRAIDGLDDDKIYNNDVDLAFMYNPENGQLYHLGEYFELHTIFSNLLEVKARLPLAFAKLENLAPNLTTRSER